MWLLQWSLLRSLIESWWRFSNLCTQLGNPDLTHAVCQSLHSHAQCIRLIIGIGFYPALSSHFPKRAVLLHYRVLQVQPWVELELICLAAVPGKMDQPGFSTYPHLLPTQCFGGSPENPPKPVYKKKKKSTKEFFPLFLFHIKTPSDRGHTNPSVSFWVMMKGSHGACQRVLAWHSWYRVPSPDPCRYTCDWACRSWAVCCFGSPREADTSKPLKNSGPQAVLTSFSLL